MAEDRDTLPQMPEPEALGIDSDKGWDGVLAYGYTEAQLRAHREEYAAARAAQAVAQERERIASMADEYATWGGSNFAQWFRKLAEAIRAGSPSPQPAPAGFPVSADERALRRLLAVRVAMPGLYLDDGEASGQQHGITIDFMREPVAHIDAKLRALNVARAICAQPSAIPAGWRLVPEGATAEMVQAAITAWVHSAPLRPTEDAGARAWRAALAAAPQPPSAWRPISEAPRDGSDVLIYVAATREQFVGYWRDDSDAFVIVGDGRGGWIGLEAPTHWQPLPPPPSAGEEPT
jgi:hypothetical protein